jgi:hypothetical protein
MIDILGEILESASKLSKNIFWDKMGKIPQEAQTKPPRNAEFFRRFFISCFHSNIFRVCEKNVN